MKEQITMHYAIYSKKQAELSGEFEYQTLAGETVIATAVSKIPGCPETKWNDKVDLGPVVQFVRRISKGSLYKHLFDQLRK